MMSNVRRIFDRADSPKPVLRTVVCIQRKNNKVLNLANVVAMRRGK